MNISTLLSFTVQAIPSLLVTALYMWKASKMNDSEEHEGGTINIVALSLAFFGGFKWIILALIYKKCDCILDSGEPVELSRDFMYIGGFAQIILSYFDMTRRFKKVW